VVTLLPFPAEPPHLKSILMAVLTIIAVVVIIQRAGWLGVM
jgi:hypothetical protein